jgi:pimeloyl-ACP methyl ester carboxylesterase
VLRAFGGGAVFGEAYGLTPARVLALHGWQRSHLDFSTVLASGPHGPLDAIAVDLPGFGATPSPATAWGSPQYAEALLPLLDELGEDPVIVGHSFGGRVALHLGALAGDRIAGLVLSGVPLLAAPGRPRTPRGYALVRRLARHGLISEGRLEAARRRYGSADYRAASGVLRETLVIAVGERYEEAIAAVRAPVTLIWGAEDTAAPLAQAEAAASRFPHARLVVCPGVGHLVPTEAPDALREAIEEAL